MPLDQEQQRLAEELIFSGKKKPSFAKQFFFGVFDANRIFPYPTPSEADVKNINELLVQLKNFADKEINPDWIDRNGTIPENVVRGLGNLGIMGITVPQEYGGLGMSQDAYCRTTEFLASRCASTALLVNAHQSIGVKAILLFGTPEQKARWLPKLSSGEQIAAFSLTEPNAGSDASGIETRAVYDPSRNAYLLTGNKQWTTSGSIASVLVVMAKTAVETPQGIQDKVTAFIVTPDMPGFQVTAHALEKVGMRGTKTANLSFNNMIVPAENVLGPIGGGLRVCLTALDYGRTTFGATCTGAAKFLMQRAIYHSKTRYQFKRPLASFAMVKKMIATMSALTYAMDASTYMTAGLIDSDASDVMLESAILKVFSSEALWQILYDTMQIYGGRSLFSSEPLERMMRDARLNMIGEGSNEVLRVFIGAVGMRDVGMELKGFVDSLKDPWKAPESIWQYGRQHWHRRKTTTVVPVRSNLIEDEARALGRAIKRFGYAVVRALGKHREQIVEQQLVLNRISTSAISIYTMAAVLSKIDRDLYHVKGDSSALGTDLASAKFYCQLALKNLDQALSNLFDSSDASIESLSDKITR